MIRLEYIYLLMGIMLAGISLINAIDRTTFRRWNNTWFWGLYAVTFLLGSHLSDFANGLIVLGMVYFAARGLGQGMRGTISNEERLANARRFRNRLFVPVLIIPLGTLLGTLTLRTTTLGGALLIEPGQVTLISLGLSTLLALGVGIIMLRPPAAAPAEEARRLMDSVGWAAVLPQSLAALGAVFAAAGVGEIVAKLATEWLPLGTSLAVVITYAIGMAVFTMIMGNAFAAFPVMTAGIGLPLIVNQFGGDVVTMSAIGMLSGFCGTLMTPMAANFNIVPAALLELRDRNGVIKAQIPTALLLLSANIVLMYVLVFRGSK